MVSREETGIFYWKNMTKKERMGGLQLKPGFYSLGIYVVAHKLENTNLSQLKTNSSDCVLKVILNFNKKPAKLPNFTGILAERWMYSFIVQ